MRKLHPESRTYIRLANQIARDYTPPISPCSTCGFPVIQGYECENCMEMCDICQHSQERDAAAWCADCTDGSNYERVKV